MRKKIFSILLIILLSSNIYCNFLIIDTFKMPNNKNYYKNFTLKFNKIKDSLSKNSLIDKNTNQEKFKQNINIKLTGIIKLDSKFFAILNGEPYSVGNSIENYKIEKIEINKVLLVSSKNKNIKVTLEIEN